MPVRPAEKRCLTAYQASQLKNEDGQHEDPFHGKVLVSTPPHGLRGSNREEHGGAIPADIVKAVELTSDAWNRRGNDGLDSWVTVISLLCNLKLHVADVQHVTRTTSKDAFRTPKSAVGNKIMRPKVLAYQKNTQH